MIVYQDWRAMWLGVLAIIAQHTLFSFWHNAGVHPGGQAFFEPSQVSVMKIGFHFGIALVQVAFAAYCAQAWRASTERGFALAVANERLRGQEVDLQKGNQGLASRVASLASRETELQMLNAQLQQRATVAEEASRKPPIDRSSVAILARVSQNLRTPIDSISTSVGLLEMGIRGQLSIEQLVDLRRIKASNQRLTALTDAILDFARIESGQARLTIAPFSVSKLLMELKVAMTARIAAASIRSHFEDCEPSIRAVADVERTRQVIVNLVTNAVRSTPPGGTIAVGCREISGKIEIWVRDTGRGISAHEAFLIFEPFVHVDRSTAPEGDSGLGLGLAISRRLARLMNGELRVKSAKGGGATFTLVVPSDTR
jgi:signal transduction histidine kinase